MLPRRAMGGETIEALPDTWDVFVSHSRRDRDFIAALETELLRLGRRPWIDVRDIQPTAEFWHEIQIGIERSENFLFVISGNSLASTWCRKELDHAISLQKRLIPLRIEDVDRARVPFELASRQELVWGGDRAREDNASALVSVMDTDLEEVRYHSWLLARSIDWERRGKSQDLVLAGKELRQAEQWLSSREGPGPPAQPTLNAARIQSSFIAASRSSSSNRRLRLAVAAFGALLAIVLLGFATLSSRRKALVEAAEAARQSTERAEQERLARSRGLAAASVEELKSLDLSLLLAVEAVRVAPTSEARDALLTALIYNPRLRGYLNDSTGSPSSVHGVAYSPDGAVVATLHRRREGHPFIRLWNARDRKSSGDPISDESLTGEGLTFLADAQHLAACGNKGPVLFDLSAAPPLVKAGEGWPCSSLAYHRATQQLAAARGNGAYLWDQAKSAPVGEPLRYQSFALRPISFSGKGDLIFASLGYYLGAYDVASQEHLRGPFGLTSGGIVRAIAASPDGNWLAVGHGGSSRLRSPTLPGNSDEPGTLLLWQLAGRERGRATFLPDSSESIFDIAFSADSKLFATVGASRELSLWLATTGTRFGEPLAGHFDVVQSVAFAPDAEGPDRMPPVPPFRPGRPESERLRGPFAIPDRRQDSPSKSARESDEPDSEAIADGHKERFLVTGGWDGAILWNAVNPAYATQDRLGRRYDNAVAIPDRLRSLALLEKQIVTFSGDLNHGGSLNVTVLDSGEVTTQRDPSFERVTRLDTSHQDGRFDAAISPDGSRLAFVHEQRIYSDTIKGTDLRVWNLATQAFEPAPAKSCTLVRYAPDGSLLCGLYGGIEVYGPSGRLLLKAPGLKMFETSGDGRRVVLLEEEENGGLFISIRSLRDGIEVARKQVDRLRGDPTAMAATAAGDLVLLAAADQLLIWSVGTETPLERRRLPQLAQSVAIAPDGGLAAVGLQTGVMLYDLARRQIVGRPILGHAGPVWWVAFSRDSRKLVTASTELVLWDVEIADWIRRACDIARRSLSEEEWNTYVRVGQPGRCNR